jgi:hypothetical protein
VPLIRLPVRRPLPLRLLPLLFLKTWFNPFVE